LSSSSHALVDEAPAGDDWLHEVKYDGYRMHARLAVYWFPVSCNVDSPINIERR